jgi:putative endonuclease
LNIAVVYILYSKKLCKYYIGSCKDLETRLFEHKSKKFKDSFTSKAEDWELYYVIENLEYKVAREIENQIKKMKSKKYIEDLKKYPEMSKRLVDKNLII